MRVSPVHNTHTNPTHPPKATHPRLALMCSSMAASVTRVSRLPCCSRSKSITLWSSSECLYCNSGAAAGRLVFIVTSGGLGGGVGQDVIPACVDALQQLSEHRALDQQGLLLVLRQWGTRRCLWASVHSVYCPACSM